MRAILFRLSYGVKEIEVYTRRAARGAGQRRSGSAARRMRAAARRCPRTRSALAPTPRPCAHTLHSFLASKLVLRTILRISIKYSSLNSAQFPFRQFSYQTVFKPISNRQFETSEVMRILNIRHVISK
jgi:hypothetical protein